ncbi:hypothetical protein O181_121565 [Austropuccinia psidii MF-1]|uniref:Uncharacterized protein n=1 Tax=Austropuccinia psidii MF-1 TaxID=1389203 RepID=A0A9Q3KHT2_9BASI|nr:hypothetical protein [Austropuccinia psidii MF-1]
MPPMRPTILMLMDAGPTCLQCFLPSLRLECPLDMPPTPPHTGPILKAAYYPYAQDETKRHQGESRVNFRRLTSRQANVKQDKSRAHVKRKSSKR